MSLKILCVSTVVVLLGTYQYCISNYIVFVILFCTGENKEQMQQALSLALKDGVANSSSVTIYVLGQQKAGKTCLVGSLLGDMFVEQIGTHGADVDICKIFASKWSRLKRGKCPKNCKKSTMVNLR